MFIKDLLRIHYVVSNKQKDLFTPNHKRWDVYLIYGNKDDLKVEVFNYQCNKNEEPQFGDVMTSLVADALFYISATDVLDFACDLGINLTNLNEIEEVRATYKQCGEEVEKLKRLFGDDILYDDTFMDLYYDEFASL